MKKYQYRAIHTAVAATWGKPTKCEKCHGKEKSKRVEWSNKDHNYSLLREDWWQLCAICHRRYDREKFGYTVWNKGKKGRQPNHNTNGLIVGGWNKGVRKYCDIQCICGTTFSPPKATSRFCSRTCAMLGNSRAKTLLENKLINSKYENNI